MPLIELAPNSRSKCRGCEQRIAAGVLRLGESLPNPFAEGETVHWFHADCAAYKRPEMFLELHSAHGEQIEHAPSLALEAQAGLAHPRLQRANGVERATSGRAACRACKALIEKGAWRIALAFHEEGRFSPAGYLHLGCARAYFEHADLMPRLLRFSAELGAQDVQQIEERLSV